MTAAETALALQEKFPGAVLSITEFRGESSLMLTMASLIPVMTYCQGELAFDLLIDISSVDNMGEDPRYVVVYELYSLTTKNHLRIKVSVSEDDLNVPTVSQLWPTADWHEREIYDMMGIQFTGHPDLRRILMWDGYPYHPLRKDFPMGGLPSDMPDVAFSETAPLAGGPFVTSSGAMDRVSAEPRAKGEK
jgi:NADH-quinone oxidoreductase subunit C